LRPNLRDVGERIARRCRAGHPRSVSDHVAALIGAREGAAVIPLRG